MRARKIAPDAILYNAIIDALWETGVIWAQRKVRPRSPSPQNPDVMYSAFHSIPHLLMRRAAPTLPCQPSVLGCVSATIMLCLLCTGMGGFCTAAAEGQCCSRRRTQTSACMHFLL